jgi:hypothetical protein
MFKEVEKSSHDLYERKKNEAQKKSGAAGGKKRKWSYLGHMQFLERYFINQQ